MNDRFSFHIHFKACSINIPILNLQYKAQLNQTVIMGNACDICEQQAGGETGFTPYNQRTYTKPNTIEPPLTIKTTSTSEFRQIKNSQFTGTDSPHPNNVTPTTLSPLSPIVKEVLNEQIMRKPFDGEMVSGTKFPPFQLKNQKKSYDGEWKNGIPHGKGKAYYDDGTYFQGYFKNGVADCNDGIIIYPDGTFYRGQIKNSKSNGLGTLKYRDNQMTYTGNWIDDKPSGMGKQTYKDGSSYVGNFVNGQKEGSGTFKWADGSEYKGQFSDGCMHGQGEHIAANGQTYKGGFSKNRKEGKGIQQSSLGIYDGDFLNDKKNGYGQFTFADGRVFRGGFLDGYPEGQGSMRMPNGQVINGLWRNGEIYSIEGSSKVINGGMESRPSILNSSISNQSQRHN